MIIDSNDIPFFNEIYNYILDHLVIFIIIFSLIGILIYSVTAVFLNKLNNEMYGKNTWMAWIPGFRAFLLGKLTIHLVMGIILFVSLICTISFSLNIDGVDKTFAILPTNIREPFTIIYISLCIILYVCAHIKLSNIRTKGKGYSSKIEVNEVDNSNYEKRKIELPVESEIKKEVTPKQSNSDDDFYSAMYLDTKKSEDKTPVTLQDLIKKPDNNSNDKKTL